MMQANMSNVFFLVMLLFAFSSAYIELEFGLGTLVNKSAVVEHVRKPDAAAKILLIENKLNRPLILITQPWSKNILKKVTHPSVPSNAAETLVSLTSRRNILQILSTDFPGLPYLLMEKACLVWTNPYLTNVLRWLGDCDRIAENPLNHTNWRNPVWKNNTASIPKEFYRIATNPNKKIYIMVKSIKRIFVVSPTTTDVHYHIISASDNDPVKTIFCGGGYLYYYLKSGCSIGRFHTDTLDIPSADNDEPLIPELLTTNTPSECEHGPWNYGSFSDVIMPRIKSMKYFKNGYIFMMGQGGGEIRNFRLIDTNARLIKPVCLDAGFWLVFTPWNKNNSCINRFLNVEERINKYASVDLLTHVPDEVHLFVKATVSGGDLTGGKRGTRFADVEMEWAFKYGSPRDGFTPHRPQTPRDHSTTKGFYQSPTRTTAAPTQLHPTTVAALELENDKVGSSAQSLSYHQATVAMSYLMTCCMLVYH